MLLAVKKTEIIHALTVLYLVFTPSLHPSIIFLRLFYSLLLYIKQQAIKIDCG